MTETPPIYTHGGSRPNSGRPPKDNGRSTPKSIKVSQEVAEYLNKQGTGIIEDLIRRSKAFREWLKSRGSA